MLVSILRVGSSEDDRVAEEVSPLVRFSSPFTLLVVVYGIMVELDVKSDLIVVVSVGTVGETSEVMVRFVGSVDGDWVDLTSPVLVETTDSVCVSTRDVDTDGLDGDKSSTRGSWVKPLLPVTEESCVAEIGASVCISAREVDSVGLLDCSTEAVPDSGIVVELEPESIIIFV